jgi:hypothetical protein
MYLVMTIDLNGKGVLPGFVMLHERYLKKAALINTFIFAANYLN